MQKFSYVLFFFLMSISFVNAQKEKIVLTISCRGEYCGGARPSQEMIEAAQRSKPYANKVIVIISDKYKVDSVKTNDKGELIFKIKPGKYKLYEAWKYYKTGSQGMDVSKFDRECLKMEWNQEIYRIIKEKKKKTRIEVGLEIMNRCEFGMPCLRPENMHPPE